MSLSNLLTAILLLCSTFLVTSCERINVDDPMSSGARFHFVQMDPDEARTSFAKTLAKAMEKKELRIFIKTEALKQFDKDYDVFFHAQKNRKIVGDTTLFDLLAAYHGSAKDFFNVTQNLPKLTIFVPELFNEKFYNSAATWDTENFVPKVAAFGTQIAEKKSNSVDAYDSKAKVYSLNARQDPDELVLVVKDNERIELSTGISKVVTTNTSTATTSDAQKEYYMSDGDNQYYFSSPDFNGANQHNSKGGRLASTNGVGFNFGVGIGSPEGTAHALRSEAPRGYAYYKSYYDNGQLVYNMFAQFPGQFDYTVKDRIAFIRFTNEQKIKDISEQWSEGNLELTGRIMIGGRVPEAFTNLPFGSISFERFAAQLTVPGFADAVEAGYGEICVPKFPFGCNRINPLRDAFYRLRDQNVLYDNRGSSTNSGVWLNWNGGTEIFSWEAYDFGNRAILVIKEKDGGEVIEKEYTWTVGLTGNVGKKDGNNLSFNASTGGKTTVKWTNNDDDVCDQFIDYNGQYGAFKPAVNAGDVEFVLRVF